MARRRELYFHQISVSDKTFKIRPIIRLWILRLLVPLGGHRDFINGESGFIDDNLAKVIGLGNWVDSPSREFNPKQVLAELRILYKGSELRLANARLPLYLRRNLARLSELVGLSDADCRIMGFAVLVRNEPGLIKAAAFLESPFTKDVFHILSVLLDLPAKDVRASLSPHGILAKSGLISIDHGYADLREKIQLLSETFADRIISFDTDPVNLLRDMVAISSPAQLALSDYEHIAQKLSILRPYLKCCIEEGRKGVNVLLFGVPGTGKTQLTKLLAREAGCELFEIASEDEDGDPADGEDRLRAYRAAQSFFAKRRAMLLFDEIEDVIGNEYIPFGLMSTAKKCKGWMNRMLEENPLPTVWVANSIDGLDHAFVRRFDMVFELSVPPRRQRERIIHEACGGLLDTSRVRRLAESESLAPAVVTRAASVVRSIGDDIETRAEAVELLISQTLKAQGHAPILKDNPNRLPEIYDPAFLNADVDLTHIAAGLTQSRSGRMCLYGPPGTGKTAYGRWLAEQTGIPLLVKRASDLMSMWVGENEKNIARTFEQAEQEGALLLIDEVDSFLQDRRTAQRGWEVSLVNEMLTQMEAFSGIFIASTNLIEGLDPAMLRRFDLKVRFDYLRCEQADALFRRYCAKLALPEPTSGQLTRLAGLKKLTPGDFATVVRQNRLHPIRSSGDLLQALEAECAMKDGTRAIGFVQ